MSKFSIGDKQYEVKITGYRIVLAERAGVPFDAIGRGILEMVQGVGLQGLGDMAGGASGLAMLPGLTTVLPMLLRFLVFAVGEEDREREFLDSLTPRDMPGAIGALFAELMSALPRTEDNDVNGGSANDGDGNPPIA